MIWLRKNLTLRATLPTHERIATPAGTGRCSIACILPRSARLGACYIFFRLMTSSSCPAVRTPATLPAAPTAYRQWPKDANHLGSRPKRRALLICISSILASESISAIPARAPPPTTATLAPQLIDPVYKLGELPVVDTPDTFFDH